MLTFKPMIDDSAGWPCLRFENRKIGTEQLIPLSAKAAETIRAQQLHVRSRWPNGTPWLFPGTMNNVDGTKAYAHGSLSGQFRLAAPAPSLQVSAMVMGRRNRCWMRRRVPATVGEGHAGERVTVLPFRVLDGWVSYMRVARAGRRRR